MRAARPGMCFFALVVWASLAAQAEQIDRPIGTVSTDDATVRNAQGILTVAQGKVALAGTSTLTAKDHTATVALTRGGSIRVCRTSALHITQSAVSAGVAPLLLAIDRGALEVQMQSAPGDTLLTPDLHFAMLSPGPLDLRLHVSASGDTCVDNRGAKAPVVNITDAFGETSYQVKPGQHVLFEKGNLREVVDSETTSCGCPPDPPAPVSIAEAMLASHGKMTPAQAKAVHPFPEAVSSGLAEPTAVPPETPGTHVQVATTLSYDPAAPRPPAEAAEAEPAPLPSTPIPALPSAAPQPHRGGPIRAIGHFFKWLFVR